MTDDTPESLIPYDEIVQEALRDVVGRVLREVEESGGLGSGGVPTTAAVPFAAVTEFVDPAVDFSLKFQANAPDEVEEQDEAENDVPVPEAAEDGSNVVNVDFTRKK